MLDPITSTDREIADAFHAAPRIDRAPSLRRISDTLAVKSHWSLTPREFHSHVDVWQKCNGPHLRVPRPYRYFTTNDPDKCLCGYILMEWVDGSVLDKSPRLSDPQMIGKVALAIKYMQDCTRSTRQAPGPVSGGIAIGYPWGHRGSSRPFTDVSDLEQSANYRLRRAEARHNVQMLRLPRDECVLVHGDLHPRNVLITASDEVCLVDWETACYYPAVFEPASIRWVGAENSQEKVFLEGIAAGLEGMTEHTKEQLHSLKIVNYLSQFHSWHNPAYDQTEDRLHANDPSDLRPMSITATSAIENRD